MVTLAWQGWLERIGQWVQVLSIHLNMGFYMFVSSLLFLIWLVVVFGFDRLSYWRVTPDEIAHVHRFTGKVINYKADGMAFECSRDDLFRHWVVGFGSGDLAMHPLMKGTGTSDELAIHNVFFVGAKVERIKALIAGRAG
jgi:hypothetical protein